MKKILFVGFFLWTIPVLLYAQTWEYLRGKKSPSCTIHMDGEWLDNRRLRLHYTLTFSAPVQQIPALLDIPQKPITKSIYHWYEKQIWQPYWAKSLPTPPVFERIHRIGALIIQLELRTKKKEKNAIYYLFQTRLIHPLHKIGVLSGSIDMRLMLRWNRRRIDYTVQWEFAQLRDRNDFRSLELDQWIAEHHRRQVQSLCVGRSL